MANITKENGLSNGVFIFELDKKYQGKKSVMLLEQFKDELVHDVMSSRIRTVPHRNFKKYDDNGYMTMTLAYKP